MSLLLGFEINGYQRANPHSPPTFDLRAVDMPTLVKCVGRGRVAKRPVSRNNANRFEHSRKFESMPTVNATAKRTR
jgi:hypothetical protein